MLRRSIYQIILLVFVVLAANADPQQCAEESENNGQCGNPDAIKDDPNCPDRDRLMLCASKYLDTNGNGKLDRDELQGAINKLPWFARGIIKVLGSVDKMMAKCDIDGDDAISIDYDMQNNKETCLASCLKRKAFKGAFFPDCDL